MSIINLPSKFALMDSNNAQSLYTLISNDSFIDALTKEELAQSLKSTQLNLSEYPAINQSPIINDNIEALKALQQSRLNSNEYLGQVYNIFEKIADTNDIDAISYALKEKILKNINIQVEDIFYLSCKNLNFKLTHLLLETSEDCINFISKLTENKYIANSGIFYKHPQIISNCKPNISHLNSASRYGYIEIVKLLLSVPGIDVNAKKKHYFEYSFDWCFRKWSS